MSSFQSAPLPLITRLFANPVLHITVISFLVVTGTLYIIRQQQKQEIVRRMEYLRGGPVFAGASGTKTSKEVAVNPAAESSGEVPPPPSPTSAAVANPQPGAAVSGSISGSISGSTRAAGFLPSNRNMATVNEPVDRGQVRLKIQYVLAAKASVQRLLQEGQSHASFIDFGDVRMGVVKNAAAYLAGLDSLESIDKSAEVEGSEILWHTGEKGENSVGITSKIAIQSRDNQSIRGEIEVLKTFFEGRDRSNGPSLKSFGPAQFEVAPKSSLFLVMNLPLFAQSETVTTGFMRLFQMNNFLQRQSEFVLIIDFE